MKQWKKKAPRICSSILKEEENWWKLVFKKYLIVEIKFGRVVVWIEFGDLTKFDQILSLIKCNEGAISALSTFTIPAKSLLQISWMRNPIPVNSC